MEVDLTIILSILVIINYNMSLVESSGDEYRSFISSYSGKFMKKLLNIKRRREMKRILDKGKDKEVDTMDSSDSSTIRSSNRQKETLNISQGEQTAQRISGRMELSEQVKIPEKWTDKKNDELLYHFYTDTYKEMSTGKQKRKWKSIFAHWNLTHSTQTERQLKNHAFYLRRKILSNTPTERRDGIRWTHELNADLLRIYYETKGGDISDHKARISYQWKKQHSYDKKVANIPVEFLYNRVKRMLMIIQDIPENEWRKLVTEQRRHYSGLTSNKESSQTPLQVIPAWTSYHQPVQQVSTQNFSPELYEANEANELMNSPYYEEFLNYPTHSSVYQQTLDPELPQSSGSQFGKSQDHPDLDLRLNSYSSMKHDPDVTLRLGQPSQENDHA